ncbi:MAG: prolyl oligopeptidase family serine peptidase [Vicinamibacterales bacterium]
MRAPIAAVAAVALAGTILVGQQPAPLQPDDLYQLQSAGSVAVSPDGTRVAYAVTHSDRPGRPYSETWIAEIATGTRTKLTGGSGVRWSPDGRWVAYTGSTEEGSGLVVADARGEHARLIAPIEGTNQPLPSSGDSVAWAPDGRSIAFVSATPGPEADANGDPMVITRYLYKPHAGEGLTRFNDNKRLHVFIADVATKAVRQLTNGTFYEHSVDWSPAGDRILFVSNREPDPDRVFNYDVFTVPAAGGDVRRLSSTRSAEYYPRWSPDGTRIAFSGTTRDLTSSETTMEDTHVWVMNADGTGRIEVGKGLDERQGPPDWSPDGRFVYFTSQHRGSVRLMRVAATGGTPEVVVGDRGSVGSWGVGRGVVAYAFSSPEAPADLYARADGQPARRLTDLNSGLLDQRARGEVESLTFPSFDGTEIEAFLTKPVGLAASPVAASHPLIVMIHGGPHGQQGPAYNAKAQVYAGLGWASLMVNYRGSTGYGQKLTDAIFRDQDGGEARDVMAAVDAALARYPWIDARRLGIEGGSYGGQLTNWIITQTDRFAAAIPTAGISNLVSFNYMAYYHDYLAVEYGGFPHEDGIVEMLWERSPIRLAKNVKTPTLFIHGENDNDVPIAEAEQFYVALHEVGVDTVLLRYPREGHGLRETAHVVDGLERSIAWYRKYFAGNGGSQGR